MGRMKDIYGDLLEGIQEANLNATVMLGKLDETNKRIDGLLQLMKEMVLMEGKIDKVETNIMERLARMEASQVGSSKLIDRIIEMTLVNQGDGHAAAVHRSQSRLENNFSSPESWAPDEPDEDVWPPPGSDCVDLKG